MGCSGPGETPGAEAEPVRESWRPEVRRGGVLTAAQIVGPAEQGVARRGLALGVMDAQGVWRCQLKAGPWVWASVPGASTAAITAEDRGRLMGLGEIGSRRDPSTGAASRRGKGRWVQLASGSGGSGSVHGQKRGERARLGGAEACAGKSGGGGRRG